MSSSVGLVNIDLLSVGIAVAANLILGVIVFLKDRKSATGILFLFQTVILSLWSIVNYASYQIHDPHVALWLVRGVMFFAVPNSIIFLFLMNTFPSPVLQMSKKLALSLVGLMSLAMVITLSPYLFSSVKLIPGLAPQPTVGPGILVFIPVAIFSVILGIYFLIRRYRKAGGIEKLQLRFLLVGVLAMFSLIIILDFLGPTFFGTTRFIPLSAVFTLPFVGFTAYAVIKYRLLNVKVIATEILTFSLVVITFSEILISKGLVEIVFRSAVFVALLGSGILLINSVHKEVQQREQLEELTKKLEAANVQLEELSHFKTQLLSLASHQVKAPLAAIKGFTSILMDGLYGPIGDKVKETLGKIKNSADSLIVLINELLDMRKAEEGKMDYQFQPTKVKDLVTETMDTLQPLASEKKLEFSSSIQTEAMVSADPQKLKQVIQNLTENAIKYTPSGFVKTDLHEEGNSVVFSVTDSGYGMSKDLLPHLFEEFKRDEKIKNQIRGTGLGLFIAKKIVEAHGGQIWAESAGEGKGSRFVVRLPKSS